MSDLYADFIAGKAPIAELDGFTPLSEPHEGLLPHQKDVAWWAIRGGRRAVFAGFGLGKTRMHIQVAKWCCEKFPGKKFLIVAPLGVRHEFTKEQGPEMDADIAYCRNDEEIDRAEQSIIITNYERVRDGNIDLSGERWCGAGLDEASVLRSFGSKTYQGFLRLFRGIKHRFVFTATPSPNRHKELIHYGGFLGIMDTGDALTRFFKRDSQQANNLTLYPHMEERFWMWLSSWAVFIQKPSDLGYSDEGYDLPPMRVHWHMVAVDHTKAWGVTDGWGQAQLFVDQSSGLKEVAEVKRETMVGRVGKAKEIMAANPGRHWLLWHDLEAERYLIEKEIPEAKTAYGSQDLEKREEIILGFGRGEFPVLATKPVIAGSGCNFQKHCADAIFLGSTYKFNDFIQACHRIYRFQQGREVNIHIIFSESESPVIETLKNKWKQHEVLVAKMAGILRTYKFTVENMQLKRDTHSGRTEIKGRRFRAIHNDCVQEVSTWPDMCVDQIVTSIPFGNQYEYSPSYNDFGHNPDNESFFRQMDFLVPNLLRILKPGRIAAIHVKDRIRFGNVTGLGMPTVDPFSDDTVACFRKHGFAFMGRITVDTDVVRENNQTYRLGWSENAKDSTKMGVGMPEYVLLFRRLPSDLSDAYADFPVTKDKAIYKRSHWQLDAASFWKSSGNRLIDPDLVGTMDHQEIGRRWREWCKDHGYVFEDHVALCEGMEEVGRLPASFMLFPPISNHPGVWTDIARMRVLNSEQSKRFAENHVCPLQIDIVSRLINRYSNKGEVVYDPFAGIGTVPWQAVKMDRVGWGTELNVDYWRCAVGYCEQAEAEREMPTLFDLCEIEGGSTAKGVKAA
jgi:DNA modification methylase